MRFNYGIEKEYLSIGLKIEDWFNNGTYNEEWDGSNFFSYVKNLEETRIKCYMDSSRKFIALLSYPTTLTVNIPVKEFSEDEIDYIKWETQLIFECGECAYEA